MVIGVVKILQFWTGMRLEYLFQDIINMKRQSWFIFLLPSFWLFNMYVIYGDFFKDSGNF